MTIDGGASICVTLEVGCGFIMMGTGDADRRIAIGKVNM
jgi:hypothetical protein